MKIIIAGNLGYIGPSVTNQLRKTYPDAELIGYDIGYFTHCLSNAFYIPEVKLECPGLWRHPEISGKVAPGR